MKQPIASSPPQVLAALAFLLIACGDEETRPDASVEIVPEGPVIDVAAGRYFTCGVKSDGTVWCWGGNDYGQLGGNPFMASAVPVQVPGVVGARRVVAGFDHACALLQDATLWCWGSNGKYQLGREGTGDPGVVPGLVGVAAVSAGAYHVCVLLEDESHLCWGSNEYGQSGQTGTLYIPSPTPMPIAGIEGPIRQISAGHSHTCLIKDDGNLWCVGSNAQAALSTDVVDPTMPRVEVQGFMGVTSRVAAGVDNTCAVKNDGTMWCWGQPRALGDGSAWVTTALAPVEVPAMRGAQAIGLGWFHTCAVRDGGVSCWGDNTEGQVGPGAPLQALLPVAVPGLSAIAVLSAGQHHNCVITTAGVLSCWGSNTYGQLGSGTTDVQTAPVVVTLP